MKLTIVTTNSPEEIMVKNARFACMTLVTFVFVSRKTKYAVTGRIVKAVIVRNKTIIASTDSLSSRFISISMPNRKFLKS